jgi:MraZ protein
MTFSGQSQPKLDEKGRLILPAKWREALGDGIYLTKGQDRCVSLYTATEFSKISERLEAARQTTKAARFFVRNFMASAESLSLIHI